MKFLFYRARVTVVLFVCADDASPCFLLCFFTRMKKKENDKDEDIKEEDREPKDRRCFQCGDMGHVRRDCPEYRHLKQRAAVAPGILTDCRSRTG